MTRTPIAAVAELNAHEAVYDVTVQTEHDLALTRITAGTAAGGYVIAGRGGRGGDRLGGDGLLISDECGSVLPICRAAAGGQRCEREQRQQCLYRQ